jgi:hypothetical protein
MLRDKKRLGHESKNNDNVNQRRMVRRYDGASYFPQTRAIYRYKPSQDKKLNERIPENSQKARAKFDIAKHDHNRSDEKSSEPKKREQSQRYR